MRKIILLGASGSIGVQTIDIIKSHRRNFTLTGISVGKRTAIVDELLKDFKSIQTVVIQDKNVANDYQQKYPHIHFYSEDDGLLKLISTTPADLVVNALVGFVGFLPTIKTIELGLDLALANKESLVVGGEVVNRLLKTSKTKLFPIDSEHVALDKCLKGHKDVDKLILTASGGSFRDYSRDQLKDVTVKKALKHPSWSMGNKITIDSATMMNKGFEIIEAYYLFHFPLEKIEVLLHDESIIHSLVSFKDGSFLADIGPHDMRIPISYALFKKRRVANNYDSIELSKLQSLHFREFNPTRYPCVGYAIESLKIGGTMPAVLNAANEVAVYAFLNHQIKFLQIEEIILKTMQAHHKVNNPSVDDIVNANRWATNFAQEMIKEDF